VKKQNFAMKGLVAALAVAGLAGVAYAGPVTDSMLDAQAGESWLQPTATTPAGATAR
jgi:hypothetical protein